MPDEIGISLRLIREYRPADDQWKWRVSLVNIAMELVLSDDRDLTFTEKMRDAMAFVKSRIH